MEIRRAKKSDIPELIRLLEQVNKIHHDIRPDIFRLGTKYSAVDLEGILEDPKHYIYVATDAGAKGILGYIFCEIHQITDDPLMTDVKTFYIDDLCIDEGARGNHVGRALYDHAKTEAKELGCYNVTLRVWAGNSAEDFYRHLGLKAQCSYFEEIL